jgi:hypothetical protein
MPADAVDQVALGDDPEPRRVGVEDDGGADAALGHQARGIAQRVPRSDDQHDPAHPILYLHRGIRSPRTAVVTIGAI